MAFTKTDLHIHTTFSDGSDTVEEVLSQAAQQGFSTIAITDHNMISSLPRISELAAASSVDVALGCEFTTEFDGQEIHLLGYFSPKTVRQTRFREEIGLLMDINQKRQRKQIHDIVSVMSADYPQMSYEGFCEYCVSCGNSLDNLNQMHIADYATFLGLVEDQDDYFDRFRKLKPEYHVKKKRHDFLGMLHAILAMGGLPSIAHFGQYDFSDADADRLAREVTAATHIMGFEVYHYDHSEEYAMRYRNMVEKWCGLHHVQAFFTAGSDYHGSRKPNRLGEVSHEEFSGEVLDIMEEDLAKTVELMRERNILPERPRD